MTRGRNKIIAVLLIMTFLLSALSFQMTATATGTALAADGTTTKIEAENLTYTTSSTGTTTMNKGVSTTVTSGSYSGTGYVYAFRQKTGETFTFTMTIPVLVSKAGTYRIDVDGYTQAASAFSITAGNNTVTLSSNGSAKFATDIVGTATNVTTWSNEIYLDASITSITLTNTKETLLRDVVDRIGFTYVGTPTEAPTEAPTEEPSEAPTATPTTAPTVSLSEPKAAVNGANAFYYVISLALNDGTANTCTVDWYPTDRTSEKASGSFNLSNISSVAANLIAVLKGIPDLELDRPIKTDVTLTYTVGGNSGSTSATNTTSFNDIQ